MLLTTMTLNEALKQLKGLGSAKVRTSPFAPIWINYMVSRQGLGEPLR